MSIQEKLEVLKASHGTGEASAAELLHAMGEAIAEEERARPLRAGTLAPSFTLSDMGGASVSSHDLLEEGPVVVTFYRGLWCPYCRRDIEAFVQSLPNFRAVPASVVGVSHHVSSDEHTSHFKSNPIGFPVLGDDTGDVAVGFGIRWRSDEVDMIDQCLGSGLVTFRGTAPWIVPMQARFVINRDGMIAHAEIAYNYDQRSEPEQLLPLLKRLHGAALADAQADLPPSFSFTAFQR